MCGPTVPLSSSASEPSEIVEPSTVRSRKKASSQNASAISSALMQTTAKAQTKRHRATTVGGLKLYEFHGMLGLLSLISSILVILFWTEDDATIVTAWLVLLSIAASTTLSIHSSLRMLDHAPVQTVIWKYSGKALHGKQSLLHFFINHNLLPFTHITAPHREAFHPTSLILQYINARILGKLLLDTGGHYLPWILIAFTCLRMIPNPFSLGYRNGNTSCFVVPMVLSVMGDCGMAAYMEWKDIDGWLTLRELSIVQLSGLVIAFLFTLAIRSKKSNKSFSIPIRPLYYVTAAGVYGLVAVGIVKAKYCLKA